MMTLVNGDTRLEATQGESIGVRPIVVAVGPGDNDGALRTARLLAVRQSSEAVVMSVVPPPAVDAMHPMFNGWTLEDQQRQRLMHVHDLLHALGSWSPQLREPPVMIACGSPHALLADLARERHAQLIVMGSGPHTLRNKLFATETTLATMRKAPCPVLAVHHAHEGLAKVVVIAMDFSVGSLHAARAALPFVADGAVIHLVHAWSRIHTPIPSDTVRAVDDAYERALPLRFDRIRAALGHAHPLAFTSTAHEGSATEIVLGMANALSADLIVTGTRGHGTLERMVIGSVSTALVRGAECSVLVVPPPSDAERVELEAMLAEPKASMA